MIISSVGFFLLIAIVFIGVACAAIAEDKFDMDEWN